MGTWTSGIHLILSKSLRHHRSILHISVRMIRLTSENCNLLDVKREEKTTTKPSGNLYYACTTVKNVYTSKRMN